MNRTTAIKVLTEWDEAGRYVFIRHDFAKLFPNDTPKTLQMAINRLVKDRFLYRACRGVYVYALASSKDSHTIERIALALRRGKYNYISLESALSEYGIISQIPLDRLTVMTSGRKGTYSTPWGTIEFTHTKRSISDILDSVNNIGRPLRMATPIAAWRDLKRVGRNTHLVNQNYFNNE
ncbi:MAG: hypothetical protein U9N77_11560 [Thermodesulfobacteriota bacterium]|nr:hypothetical protein [Thermodesulfobacteriota bacterium]